MNLREKQELKDKVETVQDLLNCIDPTLVKENPTIPYQQYANILSSNLIMLVHGDNILALNIALRVVRNLTQIIKVECEV